MSLQFHKTEYTAMIPNAVQLLSAIDFSEGKLDKRKVLSDCANIHHAFEQTIIQNMDYLTGGLNKIVESFGVS